MPACFLSEGDSCESTWHWTDTEPTAYGKARPERATARRSEPIHGFNPPASAAAGLSWKKKACQAIFSRLCRAKTHPRRVSRPYTPK